MNFDWLMRKAIKYLLASLLLFVLAGAVHAEEDKWIDGIKIRYGTLRNTTTFSLKVSDEEGRQGCVSTFSFKIRHRTWIDPSPVSAFATKSLENVMQGEK